LYCAKAAAAPAAVVAAAAAKYSSQAYGQADNALLLCHWATWNFKKQFSAVNQLHKDKHAEWPLCNSYLWLLLN